MGFTTGIRVEWFVTNNLSLVAEMGLKVRLDLRDSGVIRPNVRTYADFFPQISIKFYF
jgi:hypothetical protein